VQKDINKVREVFDDFLAKYPLCYGYWMQYVGAEASVGDQADAVLERGVAATPYSIELWLHYIDRVRKSDSGNIDFVRTCVLRLQQPRRSQSCASSHAVACALRVSFECKYCDSAHSMVSMLLQP
jgi:hypothetical protein